MSVALGARDGVLFFASWVWHLSNFTVTYPLYCMVQGAAV